MKRQALNEQSKTKHAILYLELFVYTLALFSLSHSIFLRTSSILASFQLVAYKNKITDETARHIWASEVTKFTGNV